MGESISWVGSPPPDQTGHGEYYQFGKLESCSFCTMSSRSYHLSGCIFLIIFHSLYPIHTCTLVPSLLAIDGTPPDAKTLADSEQLAAVAKTRDASHYKGELVKGEGWGKGTYIYKDGSVYDGEWRANKRHGVGKHTSADGSLYDGEWNYDQRSGSGKFMSTHDGMLPFFRWFFPPILSK